MQQNSLVCWLPWLLVTVLSLNKQLAVGSTLENPNNNDNENLHLYSNLQFFSKEFPSVFIYTFNPYSDTVIMVAGITLVLWARKGKPKSRPSCTVMVLLGGKA